MTLCPCGSKQEFSACCKPYLDAEKTPATPEALMRSRYTAYTQANIDYIKKTMRGKAALGFNDIEASRWASRVIWIKLDVIRAYHEKDIDFVEFSAVFIEGNNLNSLHELSEFIYENDCWYYVEGSPLLSAGKQTLTRNSKCPCGSQKKFKNCHSKY